MEKPIGFRFHPTDDEMVDNYLRRKNLESDTSDVDKVISTVDICSFDPWELPSESKIISKDQTWYFYGRKENKYNRGDRQSRKTKSGFWKKTGVTMDVVRKKGNREKIGEKRVLVFQFSKNQKGFGSKTGWVMHEYQATFLSPNQMMAYTICKVKFKGERKEIYCSSGGEIQSIHSLVPQTNQSGGLSTGSEGSSLNNQELQNLSQSNGYIDEEKEAQLQDALNRAFDNLSRDDWSYLSNVDGQSNNIVMQENCSHYRPQKPLSGVFDDHCSDDDDDCDLISATTKSIQTSSTCDSFASSNHGKDQIKTLQSPDLSIKSLSLTQETSGQGTEIGEHKLGQEMIKKKKAGFCNRMIQGLIKKVHLCSSISEHDINN